MVFDQNTDKAFQRTQNGAMDHDGNLAGVVFGDILGTQSHRHGKINLDRTALPHPSNGVFQGVFDFWTIEGTIARRQFI